MRTNTSMTLYHRKYDEVLRKDKWIRYNINEVMWQGGKGSRLDRGLENANDVKIFDFNTQNIKYYKIGDIVVKGTLNLDIKEKKDLNNYEFYILTTIVLNDFGSSSMQHIELGGK